MQNFYNGTQNILLARKSYRKRFCFKYVICSTINAFYFHTRISPLRCSFYPSWDSSLILRLPPSHIFTSSYAMISLSPPGQHITTLQQSQLHSKKLSGYQTNLALQKRQSGGEMLNACQYSLNLINIKENFTYLGPNVLKDD